MGTVTRKWIVFAIITCGLGVVFVLMGMGMNLGRWWPVPFAAAGLASIAANPGREESLVFGFLLLGWSALAILSLHHSQIEFVRNGWLFFFGSSIIWIPLAFLLGRLIGR